MFLDIIGDQDINWSICFMHMPFSSLVQDILTKIMHPKGIPEKPIFWYAPPTKYVQVIYIFIYPYMNIQNQIELIMHLKWLQYRYTDCSGCNHV